MKNKLKEIRESKGLTQAQVAAKAGLPFRSYQNYELGLRKPNIEAALKIALVLNAAVELLFFSEAQPFNG